ncbi:MAG TPA: VCBS repeat-containing protein [Longimicrobiales bacterium]
MTPPLVSCAPRDLAAAAPRSRPRWEAGRIAACLLSALCLAACSAAQGGLRPLTFVRDVAPFPVLGEHGNPYDHPFLGGLDVPRPQLVDIDADGDLDLFVQERSGELMFLENMGTPQAPRFVWRTDRFRDLDVGEWTRFADIDGDGDPDLLAEERYSYIRVYINDGPAGEPRFMLVADSLRDEDGAAIFADRQNIPSVADIDCDSLPDLFLGRVEGTITRLEATSRVAPGAVPRFRHVTDRFENIEIIGQIGSLHGANSMSFADVDDDGDLDLFWGDFFEPGVLFIPNTGTCSTPGLRTEPVPLRTADGDTLRSSGYNVTYLADIDADGDLDLFVGVLGGAFNPNLTASDNFYFLERTAGGEYALRTRRYLSQLDVGSESVPALGDIDGDGDLDLLVGNKLDPANPAAARLYVFENEGGAANPAFRLADTLDLAPAFHYAPALADLDADGDLDLALGTWNDGVLFYINEGTRHEPRWVQDTTLTLRLTRGSNATPAFADIDGDGDLDLLVGEASGELNYFRNEGTQREPRFVLVSDRFQEIDAGRRSHPALLDIDGDGDLDLLVGREEGGVAFYLNTGTTRDPRFQPAEPPAPLPLHPYAAPAPADLDGDGRADLVVGSLGGGLLFFRER